MYNKKIKKNKININRQPFVLTDVTENTKKKEVVRDRVEEAEHIL